MLFTVPSFLVLYRYLAMMERDETTPELEGTEGPRQPPNLWILVWMTVGSLIVAVAVIALTLV